MSKVMRVMTFLTIVTTLLTNVVQAAEIPVQKASSVPAPMSASVAPAATTSDVSPRDPIPAGADAGEEEDEAAPPQDEPAPPRDNSGPYIDLLGPFPPTTSTLEDTTSSCGSPGGDAQPTILSTGRLSFAPSIDADDDPASNPVAAEPVPVIDLAGKVRGLIALTARLEPDDPESVLTDVPVTFRVWNGQDLQLEQTVRGDRSGTASVQIYLEDVSGEYAYQVSAPGYGETELRHFNFDPAQASYTLHADGAQLWYWRQRPGQVMLTLRSPVPLDVERDQATLVIVRQTAEEQSQPVQDELTPLQSLLGSLGGTQQQQFFPQVSMQVVGTFTATASVQLPAGDYGFVGSVVIGAPQTEQFYSQRIQLEMAEGATPLAAEPLWVSPSEYAPDQRLVQYRAPAGQAAFDLLHLDQLAEMDAEWEQLSTCAPDSQGQCSTAGSAQGPCGSGKGADWNGNALGDWSFEELTLEAFREELASDSQFKDLHDYARELGYVNPLMMGKKGFGDGSEVILAILYSEASDVILLFKSSEGGESDSALMKLEGETMTVFDREAWIAMSEDSVSEWALHHSCNRLLCKGRCLWENKKVFYDLAKSAKDVVKKLGETTGKMTECAAICGGGAAVICGLGFYACSSAVAICTACPASAVLVTTGGGTVAIPVVCGSCVVAAGGCVAGAVLCLQAITKTDVDDCLDCGYELGKKIDGLRKAIDKLKSDFDKAVEAFKDCNDKCNACPSAYDYPGRNCHPTEECQGQEPAKRDERLGCGNYAVMVAPCTDVQFPNAVYREEELCSNCEWAWQQKELVEVCGTGEVCVDGQCKPTEERKPCDDMNACTIDECDPATGDCKNEPKDCDDGDACTIDDCDPETGDCKHEPKNCDDNNPCTIDSCDSATGGCKHEPKNCDDGDPCTMDYCDGSGGCVHRPQAGCDHPDENYDVSTPKVNLAASPAFDEGEPEVAILRQGNAFPLHNLLAGLGQPSVFVDLDFAAEDLADYPVLLIPSGGLYGLDSLPSFKANLAAYVENGGTLIVFSQQRGYEYGALPGGEVGGYGWSEDQSCQYRSVGISTYHPLLAGQDTPISDVNVDGYFTAWPTDAMILLVRTKNSQPAMLLYEYGAGAVVATTAYADWASANYQRSTDGRNLVRDMVAWAKYRKNVTEFGTSDTISVTVEIPNLHTPISTADYPRYEPGETVSLPISVTNDSGTSTADTVVFDVFDPEYEISSVSDGVSIAPDTSEVISFTYPTTADSKPGVYFVVTSLYAGETLVNIASGEGFMLGVEEPDLSVTYNVTLTLINPDDQIVSQNSYLVELQADETGTVNVTHAPTSKLGVWTVVYEVADAEGIPLYWNTKQFAVSKYTENPDGFGYQGSEITFAVSSQEESYAYGSEASFTIHVWNNGDVERTVTSWWSFPHNYWARHESIYGSPGTTSPGHRSNLYETLTVPAQSEASFVYSVPVYSYDRLWAQFYLGDETSYNYLGRASRGFYTFRPSLRVRTETDKQEYVLGEEVSILVNLENPQKGSQDAAVTVRVFNPNNDQIFEESFDTTVAADAVEDRTVYFSLPSDPNYGVYLVTAEAHANDRRIGSGSSYFRASRSYALGLELDRSDKVYIARDTMGLALQVTNVSPIAWSSAVDVSIPSIGFSDSTSFNLGAGESATADFDVAIPEDVAAGKHEILVTVQSDGATEKDHFVVPESEIVLNVAETAYVAGEEVNVDLANTGGVDTDCDCTIALHDLRGLAIYEEDISKTVLAGQSTPLTFSVPEQAATGDYHLFVQCEDLNRARTTALAQLCSIEGWEATLTTVTDAQIYLTDDDISMLTTITNTGDPIVSGTVNLQIFAAVPCQSASAPAPPPAVPAAAVAPAFVSPLQTAPLEDTQEGTPSETGDYRDLDSSSSEIQSYGIQANAMTATVQEASGLIEGLNVLVLGYDSYYPSSEGNKFAGLGAIVTIRRGSEISSLTLSDLQQYDVVYLATRWGGARSYIEGIGDALKQYVNDGGGLVIGQANDFSGSYTPGFAPYPFTYASTWYPSCGKTLLVPDHFITQGLADDDMPNIFDRISITSLDPHYTVLAKHYSENVLSLAVVNYGAGNVTLVTSNWHQGSTTCGSDSDLIIERILAWTAQAQECLLWEQDLTVDVPEGQTEEVTTTLNIPSELPDRTGKHYLRATLYNNISQTVGQSDFSTFYISDKDTVLTLETDKVVYKPNETVTVYGTVINNAPAGDDYVLSIKQDGVEIFTDAFALASGESYAFELTTSAGASFELEGSVADVVVAESVAVEEPSIDAQILAPDVVGLAAFEVGVLLENPGLVPTDLTVDMEGGTWNLTIPAGQSSLLTSTLQITQDIVLEVVLSGDVQETLQKDVVMGEKAEIEITSQIIYLEGSVEIPYTVHNTGLLDSQFQITFSLDDQTILKDVFVPQDQSVADTLSLDLAKGDYVLAYQSPFEEGSVALTVAVPKIVLTSVPSGLVLQPGQIATWEFDLENEGAAEGEATLLLRLPDFENTQSIRLKAGEGGSISFEAIVPDDLEENTYTAYYELNGVGDETSFFVEGAKVSVTAGLDKHYYAPGATALLTLDVTNDASFDLDLYARVNLEQFEALQDLDLAPGETAELQFEVPASFEDKLFYGVYQSSGRSLHLNALYLYQEHDDVNLWTDQQVYEVGETVSVYVDASMAGDLHVVGPGLDETLYVPGQTSFEFDLPVDLRSGTYYLDYTFEGASYTYPFDVVGYSATIQEFALDEAKYVSGDPMSMWMAIDANRDAPALLTFDLYGPEGKLDGFELEGYLTAGENEITANSVFNTNEPGIHYVFYKLYGIVNETTLLLASGVEYFEGVPIVSAGFDQLVDEGQEVNFSGEFAGSSALDTLTVVWDFGDGATASDTMTPTHVYADDGAYTVTLTVTDGEGKVESDTLLVTVQNVAPSVDAGPDHRADEGEAVLMTGSFTDPGTLDTHTIEWDLGDGSTASGTLTLIHTYGDDGEYVVTLTVSDDDGGVRSNTLVVTVDNVAPAVNAGPDQTGDEGDEVALNGNFADPGTLDTHTIEWDLGDGETITGTLTPTHVYGDDGAYTATLTITDDEGAVGSDALQVNVGNVAPDLTLDTVGAIPLAGGDAFLGRRGVEQTHEATATDPGSDDLSFTWRLGETALTTIYFNDGIGPDPFPSPDGVFPFTVTDTASLSYTLPGLYTLSIEVTDDDGGVAEDSLSKVLTDESECTKSKGFWKHQFSGQGNQHIDDETLEAYLNVVNFASAVFSEQVPVSTLQEAYQVLNNDDNGGDMRTNAEAQLLAAWLNFARGAVGWEELIDTDDDGVADMAFQQVMSEAETLLLDAGATHQELEHAKDLAEAVNLHDADNPLCDDDCDYGCDGDNGG